MPLTLFSLLCSIIPLALAALEKQPDAPPNPPSATRATSPSSPRPGDSHKQQPPPLSAKKSSRRDGVSKASHAPVKRVKRHRLAQLRSHTAPKKSSRRDGVSKEYSHTTQQNCGTQQGVMLMYPLLSGVSFKNQRYHHQHRH